MFKYKKSMIAKMAREEAYNIIKPIETKKGFWFWTKIVKREPTEDEKHERFRCYIYNNSKPKLDINTIPISELNVLYKKVL